MSEKDVQITYNTSLEPLATLLAKVHRGGEHFHAAWRETPMPALKVQGAGMLSFPVTPDQAKKLIASAGERAPYGRGARTLVDESVRKVWQIAPEKISIRGGGWQASLDAMVAECARGLGCDPDTTGAEFYKLLVYDKGGFFAAHRDTEKSGGMFGTLVVSLPSEHQGGALVIRHSGRETEVDLRCSSPSEIRAAAFYADCEHEVRPVTKGYRVCLVYNLVQKNCAKPPAIPDHRAETAAAARILGSWARSRQEPDKLVYLLEHQYTQAGLCFAGLKNTDAARARILRDAAAQAECAVHLGIVHVEESGWAEYNGDYHDLRSYWEDDEDGKEDSSEYEIGEVCDGRYFIDQWRDASDREAAFGEIPLKNEEILPFGALDHEEPDEEHFSEATGNAGASFERTYLRAGVVLWPEHRFDDICISTGIDADIARLGQFINAARSVRGASRAKAEARVRRFAAKLPMDLEPYGDHAGRLDALLRHLTEFGDAELLERIGAGPMKTAYDARLNPALFLSAQALGLKPCLALFHAVAAARSATHPGGLLMLWTGLAEQFPGESRLLAGLFESLREQLASCKPWKSPQPPESAVFRRSWSPDSDEEMENLLCDVPPAETGTKPTPEALAGFLCALENALGTPAARSAVAAIGANGPAFPPEPLLLPALEKLSDGPAVRGGVRSALWELCAAMLLRRSSVPPAKPKDWTQEVRIPGSNPLLRELEAFARDPDKIEHRFRVRKNLRQLLHQAISKAGIDMTHVTDRKGSPQTLICTKTRTSYEKACKKHQSDLANMRRLLELPPAKTSPAIAAKLRRVLQGMDS